MHKLRRSERIDVPAKLVWVCSPEQRTDWKWAVPYIPLLSPAFRAILDEHRGEHDEIQWVPAMLRMGDAEEERWIPHFPRPRDILDGERTDWGPSGLPIRWVLSESKMVGVAVTALPNELGDMIVSDATLKALRQAKLSGFRALPARFD